MPTAAAEQLSLQKCIQNDSYTRKIVAKVKNQRNCALVVTSDLANAALLRAGASSLPKLLAKVTQLVQIQTQTQIQIWLSPGCLLVPSAGLLGASWRILGVSWFLLAASS